MSFLQWVVLGLILQRLIELIISKRNYNKLITMGATEVGSNHYPIIILIHASWLSSLFFLGASNGEVIVSLLLTFFLLQLIRIWIIISLGIRWTTRIVILPNSPLVKRGPYRWFKHPNYFVVAAEILVLPLAFGHWEAAVIFSLANSLILFWRIHVENLSLKNVSNY